MRTKLPLKVATVALLGALAFASPARAVKPLPGRPAADPRREPGTHFTHIGSRPGVAVLGRVITLRREGKDHRRLPDIAAIEYSVTYQTARPGGPMKTATIVEVPGEIAGTWDIHAPSVAAVRAAADVIGLEVTASSANRAREVYEGSRGGEAVTVGPGHSPELPDMGKVVRVQVAGPSYRLQLDHGPGPHYTNASLFPPRTNAEPRTLQDLFGTSGL